MPPDLTNPDVAVLNARLDGMQRELSQLSDATKSVADSLVVLIRLEESHKSMREHQMQAESTMKDINKRLSDVEKTMPGLRELRRWVIGGILAGIGLIAAALLKLVIVDPMAIAKTYADSLHRAQLTSEQPKK